MDVPLLIRGGERVGRRAVVREGERQLRLAGPLIVSSVLQFSLNVISLMFVGHLGELPLAGASMATSFAGVTGFSLLLGMGSALDTFCGQAFGAGQYHALGIHMQRAMLVLSLVSVPLAFVWAFTGQILAALGQDPAISAEAGAYARWMIPSLFAYALLQCYSRFLQTQGIVMPMMLGSAATALLHVFICRFLVFDTGLGASGAAIANFTSYWINVAILAVYVRISPSCKKTWTGFSAEALNGVLCYARLAVPSAVMVCLEFWSFECLVLLSGLLPNPTLETSVLSISLNTSALIFMVPLGLGNAVSTRVSNELGAGHPRAAKLAIYVVVFLALVESLLVVMVTVLVRRSWGYMYSSEEEVVRYLSRVLPIVAASNFMDSIQCVLSGTIRGSGRQKIGALINLGAYYIMGLPSSVLLAFVLHVGGRGLWMGIICALFVQNLMLSVVTLRTDWEKEALKSKERVNYEGLLGEPSS